MMWVRGLLLMVGVAIAQQAGAGVVSGTVTILGGGETASDTQVRLLRQVTPLEQETIAVRPLRTSPEGSVCMMRFTAPTLLRLALGLLPASAANASSCAFDSDFAVSGIALTYVAVAGAAAPPQLSMVKDIEPTGNIYYTGGAVTLGEHVLLFGAVSQTAAGDVGEYSAWLTDGTAIGTRRVLEDQVGMRQLFSTALVGNKVYFNTAPYYFFGDVRNFRTTTTFDAAVQLTPSVADYNLQALSDATTLLLNCPANAGTTVCAIVNDSTVPERLQDSFSGSTGSFARLGNVNGLALFRGFESSDGVWRSDGTAAGTFRVSSISPWWQEDAEGLHVPSVMFSGKLYFVGQPPTRDRFDLMTTDGTTAGTQPVATIASELGGNFEFVSIGDRFVFNIRSSDGWQLWSSDGTEAGTFLIHSDAGFAASHMVAVGATAHVVVEGSSNYYLVTDGTAAGTQTVPLPLDTLPFAQVLFALDADNVIFSCFRSEIGHELCRMNPTTQEVEVVRDIYPGPRDSIANLLRSEPGYAYFTADDGIHGRELWLLEGASEIIFRSQFEDSP